MSKILYYEDCIFNGNEAKRAVTCCTVALRAIGHMLDLKRATDRLLDIVRPRYTGGFVVVGCDLSGWDGVVHYCPICGDKIETKGKTE